MTTRLEAAVKAWDHHWGDRYGDEAVEEMGEEVQVALDAADEILFSDKSVGLVAAKVEDLFNDAFPLFSVNDNPRWAKVELRLAVRRVLEALKAADGSADVVADPITRTSCGGTP